MADEHRNGVVPAPHGRKRRAFPLRLASSDIPGKIELAIALVVVSSVFIVSYLIFTLPGPLVVEARDDSGAPVMNAKVSCTNPAGDKEFHGRTDVFGEAKWPGLEKVLWTCRAFPPDRFQGFEQDGSAQVVSRGLATVRVRFDRPLHVNVDLLRPKGAPRAKMAVRALCPATQTAPEMGWESRAGLLSGKTEIWLPFGRACRIGLAKPRLPDDNDGLLPHADAELDCANLPCTGLVTGASGQTIDLSLEPSAAQWELARPPRAEEPDAGTR